MRVDIIAEMQLESELLTYEILQRKDVADCVKKQEYIT